jgi:hypothetical protein
MNKVNGVIAETVEPVGVGRQYLQGQARTQSSQPLQISSSIIALAFYRPFRRCAPARKYFSGSDCRCAE